MKKRTILTAIAALLLFACGESVDDDPPADDGTPGELIQSSLERDLSPDVDDATKAHLARDNRDFAFHLLHQIDSEGENNIFFSPHSISIALAMTYAGASGGTHEQMGDLLRFTLEEEELHPAFNALDLDLDTRSDVDVEDGDPPELNIVNSIWGQRDYPFHEVFLDTLAVNYGAGLRAVDFLNQPDVERERINQWVEDQTNDRIEDLLPEGSIKPSTVLVLTNAIYFLAGWHSEFDEAMTTTQSFTRLDGEEVDVDMMSQSESFAYFDDGETLAISLPYVGEEMSFIAIKPADPEGYDDFHLDRELFDQVVSGMSHGHGSVSLPRFGFEGDYNLKDLFEKMGWTNYLELVRMVASETLGLEITDIFHKSFIDLDEEGTEAAAATAVVIGETSAPLEEFELVFDRTFYYAIYDHPTDTILFLGRVDDPTEEE